MRNPVAAHIAESNFPEKELNRLMKNCTKVKPYGTAALNEQSLLLFHVICKDI